MFFAESEALDIYQQAGCDPESPVSPEELARRLLGSPAVVERSQLTTPAAWCEGRSELWLRSKTTPTKRGWLVAHELAERHLSRLGYRESNAEAFANRIAASLIAPAPAVRLALRALDRDYEALAAAFDTSQSVMALRVGEVTGEPTALVMPTRVHIRGDDWGWPDEAQLRATLAHATNTSPLPKTRLQQLTDHTDRLLLIAG